MASPLRQPSTLDRYELGERIAVGGMAEVFRAKAFGAHGFEKPLAIKRILPELLRDPEFESRFISEAKLAVALTHANIVQVFDFGRFGGTMYIAMELVDGPDLAALLKGLHEKGDLCPVGVALQIGIEAAKGLDFAHRKGVVHRDVSPSNILISRAGEVKIADFGIALAAEAAPAASGMRKIMGKWRYMSPEQARGERLDAGSDLFSLGAVLFELFTGRKLFPGDEIEEVVRNVVDMPIPPGSSVRGELPHALDQVLLRCLERDPSKRYASAAELQRALLEVVYARSFVVTASDVADVVSRYVPARRPATPLPKPTGVDDLIAAQLAAAPSREDSQLSRVTDQAGIADVMAFDAAEHTTFVSKGLGPDGVTVFDAAPPEPVHVKEAPLPGLPPIERRVTERIERAPRRLAPMMIGALVLGVVGGGLYAFRGRGEATVVPAVVVDAGAVVEAKGTLILSSEPPGARVSVDGVALEVVTPTQISLAPGRHQVELSLAGHRVSTASDVDIGAGERLRYERALQPMRASLRVRSTPDGAKVSLDGQPLGETPLARELAADGAAHQLRLEKPGFLPLDVPVTLADGAELEVERPLAPAVRRGKLNLQVDPWAYVYFEGRRIAEAPVAGLSLPVGKQTLRLENPRLGKSKTVVVEVPEKGVGLATFSMAE